MTVASGLADMVLVVGAEKMTEVPTSVATDTMTIGERKTLADGKVTIILEPLDRPPNQAP